MGIPTFYEKIENWKDLDPHIFSFVKRDQETKFSPAIHNITQNRC